MKPEPAPPLEEQFTALIAFVWDCEREQDFQRRIDQAAAEAEKKEPPGSARPEGPRS